MSEKVFVTTHGSTFAKRCKHFDGINGLDPQKRCEAGVLMSEALIDQPYKYRYAGETTVYTVAKSMPCFRDTDPLGVCQCPHQSFPTEEEIEVDNTFWSAAIERTVKARSAIVRHADGKRPTSGELPCPVCYDGALHYSIASNGHVWAQCSTGGCVRWME